MNLNKTSKKVLILVPSETARGGITNYYQVLKKYFDQNVEYFVRGARNWPIRQGKYQELKRFWKDYSAFKKRLKKNDVDLIQTTTSLSINTILRDGLFVRHASRKGIKSIAFFRGWDNKREESVRKKYFGLFKYFFFKADSIIVLSENVKSILINWGYKKPIYVETTVVDNQLISNVSELNISQKYESLKSNNKIRLLYLSRIEKEKGLFELANAFMSLQKNEKSNFSFELNIYGDGSQIEPLESFIKNNGIRNIFIKGFVKDKEKIDAFTNSHIFVFPSYSEGMPNAVLEAMGFGLPVITTPVGGIKDIFISNVNGFFIDIKNVENIETKILELTQDLNKMKTIGLRNYDLASKRFASDKVVKRIENIFKNTLKKE